MVGGSNLQLRNRKINLTRHKIADDTRLLVQNKQKREEETRDAQETEDMQKRGEAPLAISHKRFPQCRVYCGLLLRRCPEPTTWFSMTASVFVQEVLSTPVSLFMQSLQTITSTLVHGGDDSGNRQNAIKRKRERELAEADKKVKATLTAANKNKPTTLQKAGKTGKTGKKKGPLRWSWRSPLQELMCNGNNGQILLLKTQVGIYRAERA